MSKEKTKSKSFEFNKKSIIALIIVSLAGILTGVFVGGYFIGAPQIDYSKYKEVDLRDDVSALSAKVGNNLPTKYTVVEVFETAEFRMFTHGGFCASGTGKVATIASQDIVGMKAFDGVDTYYKENISVGIKNVAERTLYKKGENATFWEADKINKKTFEVKYKEPKTRTYEDIAEVGGVRADSFIGYIVSSKTVINKNDKPKKITLEDGSAGYQFKLELHPVLSVLNYVKQMKNLSKLSSYPSFKDITLTVVVDEQYRFISIDTLEHYSVNYMGVNAGCTGTLFEKFEYKENAIPEI